MNSFIQPVAAEFAGIANADNAIQMKAYMKNKFDFFGIKTPERRKICKDYMKHRKLNDEKELETIAKELWALPEREFQYFAIELLALSKKVWKTSIIELFEFCITHKSWWDTVDFIANECTGPYFKMFPAQIVPVTDRWNASSNIWFQRSSLLFQKSYKRNTNTVLLSAYINNLSHSKEFFVQKAIGWILREYAKTNPEWVKAFVNTHNLATLSKKEALKHFL